MMNRTLAELDREWTDIERRPTSVEALRRWGHAEPALAGYPSLGAVLKDRKSRPATAPAMLAALARLAAADDLAARTLLQALMPGLVRLASTVCSDDPVALDELVSLAWERIRSYPTNRPGSVAANVLWDVRKRYREHRAIEVPASGPCDIEAINPVPSAEEEVVGSAAVDDLIAAHRDGVICGAALALILRTRVDEVPLGVAAAEQRATARQANCIRWRRSGASDR